MKESLIKFETAKLAKEKGFEVKSLHFYRDNGDLVGKGYKSAGINPPFGQGINRQLAPTQTLLQKWLRVKHGICAYIDYLTEDAVIVDHKNYEGKELYRMSMFNLVADYENDEEVVEQLLIKALKLIKP